MTGYWQQPAMSGMQPWQAGSTNSMSFGPSALGGMSYAAYTNPIQQAGGAFNYYAGPGNYNPGQGYVPQNNISAAPDTGFLGGMLGSIGQGLKQIQPVMYSLGGFSNTWGEGGAGLNGANLGGGDLGRMGTGYSNGIPSANGWNSSNYPPLPARQTGWQQNYYGAPNGFGYNPNYGYQQEGPLYAYLPAQVLIDTSNYGYGYGYDAGAGYGYDDGANYGYAQGYGQQEDWGALMNEMNSLFALYGQTTTQQQTTQRAVVRQTAPKTTTHSKVETYTIPAPVPPPPPPPVTPVLHPLPVPVAVAITDAVAQPNQQVTSAVADFNSNLAGFNLTSYQTFIDGFALLAIDEGNGMDRGFFVTDPTPAAGQQLHWEMTDEYRAKVIAWAGGNAGALPSDYMTRFYNFLTQPNQPPVEGLVVLGPDYAQRAYKPRP